MGRMERDAGMALASAKIEERFLKRRLQRRIRWARAALFAERLWPLLWPALAGLGVFAGAGLFGVWQSVSWLAHSAAFLALLVLLGWTARRAARRLDWPGEAEGRRRLERDGGARHRPLDAIFDTPALAAGAVALWRCHRVRMMAAASRLRPHLPRLSLLRADPPGLRALIVLVLAVGALYAGPQASERLVHAFTPPLTGPVPPVTIDAWITPPDYTGRSPKVLRSATDGAAKRYEAPGPVAIAEGSRLTVRLHGGRRTPVMAIAGTSRDFETLGARDHAVEAPVPAGGRLEIRQGGTVRALWPITLIPDGPPSVAFAGAPGETRRHSLRVDYIVDDDYAVTHARLEIGEPALPQLTDGGETAKPTPEATLTVTLLGADTRSEPKALTAFEDLTRHRWAGLEVTGRLFAVDAAGQEGAGAPLRFTLPERDFSHPVARRLIDIRKGLLRRPQDKEEAVTQLDVLGRTPAEFDGDLTVFSALRTAYWRLLADRGAAAPEAVAELLWDTALHLEDGGLSLAAQSLSQAMEDFEQALQRDGEGLEEAARELERMMGEFLRRQMAAERGEPPPAGMANPDMQVVGAQDLQRMIQQMRDMAAAGDKEGAMRMLQQLRRMMENMAPASRMTAADYERMMAANEAAGALEDLSREQREVLNQTSRQTLMNRMRERQGAAAESFRGLEGEQRALERMMDDIRRGLGEAGIPMPDALAEAERAMRGATGALGEESGPEAIRRQAEALDAMGEAMQDLQQSLQQAMQRGLQQGGRTDPLGRPMPGLNTQDFQLPDALSRDEVERIMEELRRRIADPGLAEEERDYLRRLLKRF